MLRSLTAQCLFGLVLGLLLGVSLPHLWPQAVEPGTTAAETLIRVWTNGFRLVVMPLVVAQLFTAVSIPRGQDGGGARLGLAIPVVFVGLLLFVALFMVVVMSGVLALPMLGDLTLDRPAPTSPAGPTSAAGGSWLDELVPANLFAAASADSLLAVMLFALAFALAARRLEPSRHQALNTAARAVRDTMFVLIGWLIRVGPLVLVAFGLSAGSTSGWAIGAVLLAYVIIAIIVVTLCVAALYPVTSLLGRVSVGRFARAVFPAQAIAATTRSSLATIPALLRGAEMELRLPERVSALVIPLGGVLLKPSRPASQIAKLLFLVHVLGISLSLEQIVVFVLTILMLSPTTQGVPTVLVGARSLPAFVAIGVPAESVLLLGATTALTDAALTVLNSTAYLSSSVLVSRLVAWRSALGSEVERAA